MRAFKAPLLLAIAPAAISLALLSCASVPKEEALANKWAKDLLSPDAYDLYKPLKLAVLMDPFLHETYARLGLEELPPVEFVRAVSRYAANETVHLQHCGAFDDEPSRMPWGSLGACGIGNVYRRLLPSEMDAMRAFAGKTSGACECLTLFFAGLFRLKGVPPEDIVHLRLPGHTVALIRYEGAFYGINNTAVGPVSPVIKAWYLKQRYDGLFGEGFALYRKFSLKEGAFEGNGSLAEAISDSSGLELDIGKDALAGIRLSDSGAIKERLLVGMEVEDPSRARFIKYASQYRAVDDFSPYLRASLRGPLAKGLAAKLRRPAAVEGWIRDNVVEPSIFADGEDRVLMADQTIVYRRGSSLDKAILAYTLYSHMGLKPRLVFEGGEASLILP